MVLNFRGRCGLDEFINRMGQYRKKKALAMAYEKQVTQNNKTQLYKTPMKEQAPDVRNKTFGSGIRLYAWRRSIGSKSLSAM